LANENEEGGSKGMKKCLGIATVLLIMGVVFGNALAPTSAQAEPTIIKVGFPGPLSGPAAPWGQIGIDAYNAFIDLLNKEGIKVGGKTYNFKPIYVDDKNTPEGGSAAAKKLIYEDKVKFIAGHWSWNFPSVAAVANAAKVIYVTRTGNEAVPGGVYDPKRMPYTVFGNPSHEQFISDCLAIVDAYPNYKKLGIYDTNLGKGIGWDYVDRELQARGIKFHHEWFPPGTQDFTPYITRFAEAGCDILYGAGDVMAAMLITKQRYEMGHKDWHTGTAGGILDPGMYIGVCGFDAAQGFIGQYFANWDFKKTKVNPKYIAMSQEVMKMVSAKQGKPFTYTGWIGWGPSHLLILAQAMEKAGTVDNTDAIMKAIRGGTFDTTTGKFTMSGAKTYGSPIVFGTPGALSHIAGDKEVYLSEHPMAPLP
jgi:ABC-type branched-subunit amino acid transport system substrate-binding protein